MYQQFGTQFIAYSKQFTDGALRAQSLALQNLESVAALQLKVLENQVSTTAEFVSELMEARDANAFRGLWEKGVSMGRSNAEQAVAVSQEIVAISQKTAESLSALVQEQRQAANDAVATPGASTKKAAAK